MRKPKRASFNDHHRSKRSLADPQVMKKNALGGVHVSRSEIKEAISFFASNDANPKKPSISMQSIKSKLNQIYGDHCRLLNNKELRLIMGNSSSLSLTEVENLLMNNNVRKVDIRRSNACYILKRLLHFIGQELRSMCKNFRQPCR